MAEAKSNSKQIMDVARPGTSAPSATSKPVLVSNRPMLKDPTITKETEQASDVPDKESSSRGPEKGQLVVKPLEPTEDKPKVTKDDEKSAVPDAEPAEEPAPSQPIEADDTVETRDSLDSEEEESPAQQTDAEADAAAKELAKHDEEIEKLTESKRYYLPINAVNDQKTKRFIIMGAVLSLILIVVWLDIALDAGLIKLSGIKAVTHFFQS